MYILWTIIQRVVERIDRVNSFLNFAHRRIMCVPVTWDYAIGPCESASDDLESNQYPWFEIWIESHYVLFENRNERFYIDVV